MPLSFCRWGAKHHRWTCEILSKGGSLSVVPQSRRNEVWQTASDVILRSIPRRMVAGLLQAEAEHWAGGEDN
jgi:hypothetical protein